MIGRLSAAICCCCAVTLISLNFAHALRHHGIVEHDVSSSAEERWALVQAKWGMADFRDAVYFPARALLDGINPYDVATYTDSYPVGMQFPLYSPLTLVIHSPLAMLPFRMATISYYWFSVGALLVMAWWIARILTPERHWITFSFVFLALTITWPVLANLKFGQTGIFLALLTAAAIHFAADRPWLAGVALGLATFKPTYGLPLAFLLLASGRGRAVLIAICVACVLTLPPLVWLIQDAGGLSAFLDVVQNNHLQHESFEGANVATSDSRIDGLIVARWWEAHPSTTVQLTLAGIVLLLAGAVLLKARSIPTPSTAVSPRAALIVVACTLSVYHTDCDWVAVAVPALGAMCASTSWRVEVPRALATLAGLLLWLPGMNYGRSSAARGAIDRLAQKMGLTTDSLWTDQARTFIATFDGMALALGYLCCLFVIWRSTQSRAADREPPN